jgi:acetate kinase
MAASKILVINVGSTSVKFDLFDLESDTAIARGNLPRSGAIEHAIDAIAERLDSSVTIDAIGHRVVHGGDRLVAPARIDERVEAIIAACARFAPLHNPASLAGIRAARARWPNVPHVAVFDTAFHATMPERAFTYALPRGVCRELGIRRYGFHGPSHAYMALCAARALGIERVKLRAITIHLGGGASVAAIANGVSVDTSMGMTPLEGLVMDTRSGDLDPAIVLLLARAGYSLDQVDDLLEKRSGLAGISGLGSDFRAIEAAAARGDGNAQLAIDVFVHRIRKYVGAYAAELGGADAIAFSGGIGEHSALVRERVCATLGFMGVELEPARNQSARVELGGAIDVSDARALTKVLVVHADEAKMIARDVSAVASSR